MIKTLIITPAYFTDEQKAQCDNAAKAFLENIEGIPMPTALSVLKQLEDEVKGRSIVSNYTYYFNKTR